MHRTNWLNKINLQKREFKYIEFINNQFLYYLSEQSVHFKLGWMEGEVYRTTFLFL